LDRLTDLLQSRRVVLGDGAMGTMLQLAGLIEGAPERWNVERPDVVSSIHRAYVEAGSDFVRYDTEPRDAFRIQIVQQTNRRSVCQIPTLESFERDHGPSRLLQFLKRRFDGFFYCFSHSG
jgi:S-methylmethionine-dependent homocysteine/selenocysteine methylase